MFITFENWKAVKGQWIFVAFEIPFSQRNFDKVCAMRGSRNIRVGR